MLLRIRPEEWWKSLARPHRVTVEIGSLRKFRAVVRRDFEHRAAERSYVWAPWVGGVVDVEPESHMKRGLQGRLLLS
jgi:hypothetical protein